MHKYVYVLGSITQWILLKLPIVIPRVGQITIIGDDDIVWTPLSASQDMRMHWISLPMQPKNIKIYMHCANHTVGSLPFFTVGYVSPTQKTESSTVHPCVAHNKWRCTVTFSRVSTEHRVNKSTNGVCRPTHNRRTHDNRLAQGRR